MFELVKTGLAIYGAFLLSKKAKKFFNDPLLLPKTIGTINRKPKGKRGRKASRKEK